MASRMLVRDLMTTTLYTVAPHQNLSEVVTLIRRERIRHIPVLDGVTLVGIASDRDVKRAMPSLLTGVSQHEYDETLDHTPVARIMTRDPMTVAPNTPVLAALSILLEKKYGALPVVEEGKLVGIVTEIDFLRLLQSMLTAS